MQELRQERDKLLEKNQKMTEGVNRQKARAERSYANMQQVAESIESGDAKEFVKLGMESGLKRQIEDCAFADALLKEARAKLESWSF